MDGPGLQRDRPGPGPGVVLPALLILSGLALPLQAQDAASLRARHEGLRAALASSPLQRPLVVASHERGDQLQGDVHAVIAQPHTLAGPALRDPSHWCDILALHLNVKQCRVASVPGGAALALGLGRKFDQPAQDAFQLAFSFRVVAATSDYLQVVLTAPEGPMGTRNYRIVLEVAGLDAGHSILHLSYAYAHGLAARAALRSYLATLGRNKLGFSVVGRDAGGLPSYVRGTRGMIEAYLGALRLPVAQQLERRLSDWYAGSERYRLQLHEIERAEYLAMKRRQLRVPPSVAPTGAGDSRAPPVRLDAVVLEPAR